LFRVLEPADEYCDVTILLAEGVEIKTHAFILASGSVVLRAMLQSDMLHTYTVNGDDSMTAISLVHHTKGIQIFINLCIYV
jgi:hypothetical protein